MRAVHDFLLFAALTVAATGLATRKHILIDKLMYWNDAQAYCRSNYVDLSTIDSPSEFERFKRQTATPSIPFGWVGLNKKPDERNFTFWSDGVKVNMTNLIWFPGEPNHPDSEHCGAVHFAGLMDWPCNLLFYFFCYTWQPKFFVVQEEKTWDEALKHCRMFYRDIVSVYSETDLVLFNNVTGGIQTPGFWTGLRFHDGSWYWVNRDGRGSLILPPMCPVQPFVCGALKTGTNIVENRDCEEKKPFVCYAS